METIMIQDILPKQYHNEYYQKSPVSNSRIFCFTDNLVLIAKDADNSLCIPEYQELMEITGEEHCQFLFTIDEIDYFLYREEEKIQLPGYSFETVRIFRQIEPKDICFAGVTANHLYSWYKFNRFCGRCGTKMHHNDKERMLYCDKCGSQIYPKIVPAIIVAVTNENKILMTQYAGRAYKNYALVAGFVEIGETLEDTVRREIMEEVGLKVKNITYYKSQPWGFDSDLLMGFFAELDGEEQVTIDYNELATAEWFERDKIQLEQDDISLTREMIMKFKNNA